MLEPSDRIPAISLQGDAIPRLGLGTWRLTGRACREAVEHAVAAGFRHIDTAAIYGNEAEVGAAVRAAVVPRNEIFLATKVWRDDLRRDALLRSAEASVRRLGGPIDLLMVHWPNEAVPLAETMDALTTAREQVLTRHVGVSNYPAAMLRDAAARSEAPILVDQCEYHPGLDQGALIETCRGLGVGFVAYRPLGQDGMRDDPTIRRIAAAHGKTPAQVILRWHMQQDGVLAIPRSASPAHIAENAAVFDFALSEAEMGAVFALGDGRDRHVQPAWAPAWDPPPGRVQG